MASGVIPVERCREILAELRGHLERASTAEMRACYRGLIGHWRAELRKAEVAGRSTEMAVVPAAGLEPATP